MAYKIGSRCLKCGVCMKQCPVGAIIADNKIVEFDGLIRYSTRIDQNKCTQCGVCMSTEWWCPAKAIEIN